MKKVVYRLLGEDSVQMAATVLGSDVRFLSMAKVVADELATFTCLPGGEYFGCRHGYDLTYKCQKEHDSRLDKLLKDPQLYMSYLNSSNSKKVLMAAKAGLRTL